MSLDLLRTIGRTQSASKSRPRSPGHSGDLRGPVDACGILSLFERTEPPLASRGSPPRWIPSCASVGRVRMHLRVRQQQQPDLYPHVAKRVGRRLVVEAQDRIGSDRAGRNDASRAPGALLPDGSQGETGPDPRDRSRRTSAQPVLAGRGSRQLSWRRRAAAADGQDSGYRTAFLRAVFLPAAFLRDAFLVAVFLRLAMT